MSESIAPRKQHVAVFAFPFGTHAAPLLNLIQRLAKSTPNNVIFSFFSTSSSNSSLFSSSSSIENIKAYNVDDGVPKGYVFSGKPQEGINLFLKVAEKSFKEGLEVAEKEVGRNVSCVISDAFMWFCFELAEKRNVPWIALWTSGAAALSTHFHTDLLRQTVGLNGISERKDELVECVPGLSKLKLLDLQSGILTGNLESPFSIMLHKMGQTLPKAKAVAINSFEDLDPTIVNDLKSKLKHFLNIGPFHLISPPPPLSSSDVHGCLPWLDRQKRGSVAYIAFGTVMTPPPHELKALAEALEASNTPFLWSLKDKFWSNLPEGFLDRTKELGKVAPWVPQVQVLSHSALRVFITHCGWNSILESISAGVPIICKPTFGDQPLNASMVQNVWQIGIKIEGGTFTKDGATQTLEYVLSSEGKKLKKQVEEFKELALKSVEQNGSSTQNFVTLRDLIIAQ